jgi:proline iminopeptidase
MKQHPISEGYMPFLGYRTYYRIVGEPSDKPALLLLHGGPGSTHNYFEVLDRIADTGRQVISYDQIGCGNSYLDGHPELWTQETWINELIALREHLHLEQVHLLGQSWGAMQAIAYIIDFQPKGVKSVILSSGHASSSLWASEQHRLIKYLSAEDQDAIRRAEATLKWDSPDYLLANEHYFER